MDTREQLSKNVETYVHEYISSTFEFREYQKESILDILENVLSNGKKCHVIQAPTGSGKSLINIISAGVLDKFYNMRSFILVSDLTLWEQYYDFIIKHRKMGFGMLKGLDNYTCMMNNLGLKHAKCRVEGFGFNQMFNGEAAERLGYPCASRCRYIKDRKQALKANVTLMTYHLYLYLVGGNYMDSRGPAFDCRDVAFCDECHNIPDIMQLRYQFCFRREQQSHLLYMYDHMSSFQRDLFGNNLNEYGDGESIINNIKKIFPTRNDLIREYNKAYDELIDYRTTNEKDYELIKNIMNIWDILGEYKYYIEEEIHAKMRAKIDLTKDDYQTLKECHKFQNFISNSTIKMFLGIIDSVGTQYLVKSINEVKNSEGQEDKICHIQCAKEDFLVHKGLLSVTPYKVMVSATIGDQDNFEDMIGVKYMENADDRCILFDYLPSTFDFTKSPIYFFNKYKMSFNEKENSLKSLKPMIYQMLRTTLKDVKGIIQTGTYAIAQEIINDAPSDIRSRLLYYNGSKEKTSAISLHQMSPNTILIGPTLCEGIDLPGDLCRFIIILKMPYPTIKDRLVSAKINLFPFWYNSVTSNQIIQGIGRGNRFKEDWCATYILDACFLKLYVDTQKQYPEEIQNRIKIFN